MNSSSPISLSQLSVYDIFCIVGPGGFFVLLLVLGSTMSAWNGIDSILHLDDIGYVAVWILVFGLLIHIPKIGDALFFRKRLKSRYQENISHILDKLGWPSVIPLVDTISSGVRRSLDRLDSLRIFCANCLFSSLLFLVVALGSILYEILEGDVSTNVSLMIPLTIGVIILSGFLYKQGANYQSLEAETLLYYLEQVSVAQAG